MLICKHAQLKFTQLPTAGQVSFVFGQGRNGSHRTMVSGLEELIEDDIALCARQLLLVEPA